MTADEPAPDPGPPPLATAPDLPLEDLDRAHLALNTPAPSAPGVAGKVVDRLLAGRDERTATATTAVGDAVAHGIAELAQRLADVEADLTRRLAETEAALRSDQVALDRRLGAVASDLAATRDDVDGALEQDRITAAIVADAEQRLTDETRALRRRVAELAADPASEAGPP